MQNGTVEWFDLDKGYGFIKPEDGSEDIFVHISEVERAGHSTLSNDQAIKYELQNKHGKLSATNIELV